MSANRETITRRALLSRFKQEIAQSKNWDMADWWLEVQQEILQLGFNPHDCEHFVSTKGRLYVIAYCSDKEKLNALEERLNAVILLPRKVAARYLGISVSALDKALERGRLSAIVGWSGSATAGELFRERLTQRDKDSKKRYKGKLFSKVYFFKSALDRYRKKRWHSLQKPPPE